MRKNRKKKTGKLCAREMRLNNLESRLLFSGSPLSSLPILHSDPGAKAEIYLDFTGAAAMQWDGVSVPATPAYDTDGDPTTFSATELSNIQQIWARVAEKFSPFNIDVTTQDPGTYPVGQVLRMVIGGNGSWYGSTQTGAANMDNFTFGTNTSFIFSSNLSGNPQWIAEATAQECGYGFGLMPQSVWSGTTLVNAYNPGNSLEAPVMGDSYSSARGVWWDGTSEQGSNDMQDDMAVISDATNGFGYRSDDQAQTWQTADPLSVSGTSVSAGGIIEKTGDTDFFSFTTGAGTISLSGNVVQYGPTLHLQMMLFDSTGNLVASADNAATLGQTLTANVAAGTYELEVASFGSYGDVGQYTVTGTVVAPPANFVAAPSGLSAATSGSAINLAWTDNASNATGFAVQRSADGGTTWATVADVAGSATSWQDATVSAGATYSYRVDAFDAAGDVSSYSNAASATAAPPIIAPSGLTAAAAGTAINLSWTDNATNATGVAVQRSADGGATWTTVADTAASATSWQDTTVSAGTTYEYRVDAFDAAGDASAYSNVASAKTVLLTAPMAPSKVAAKVQQQISHRKVIGSSVALSWTDNATAATGYYVQRSSDGGKTWQVIATLGASATSYTDSSVTHGVTYEYQIGAFNSAATAWSSPVTASA